MRERGRGGSFRLGSRRGRRKAPLPAQLSLAHAKTRGRGGPRAGAGRKEGPRPKVRHRAQPTHRGRQPVHVTLRCAKGIPNLRSQRLERLLREAIACSHREGLRIAEDSIQGDDVHMLVEADDAALLTHGMRSLTIRWMQVIERPPEPPPVMPARTWLLSEGWTTVGHGLLHVGELPRAARQAR